MCNKSFMHRYLCPEYLLCKIKLGESEYLKENLDKILDKTNCSVRVP